jgi:pilus assembly protein Flp/PilA
MQTLNKTLLAFWKEESGLTIVEYALTGALIAVVAITALTTLGTTISTKLGTIATAVTPAA